jgi:hypothetical protein
MTTRRRPTSIRTALPSKGRGGRCPPQQGRTSSRASSCSTRTTPTWDRCCAGCRTARPALGLDFAALGAHATWPALVARRIVAQQLPGLTPKKRGAPAPPPPPDRGGQIQKPGAAPERPVTSPPDERRKRRAKKAAKAAAASSSSDCSSGDSPDSDLEVLDAPIAPAALMPAELGYGPGPAFDALVAAGCARSWIATDRMERGIPAAYISCLYRARLWSSKELDAYDKMICRQTGRGKGGRSRREDPRRVAFPHRLSLVFTTRGRGRRGISSCSRPERQGHLEAIVPRGLVLLFGRPARDAAAAAAAAVTRLAVRRISTHASPPDQSVHPDLAAAPSGRFCLARVRGTRRHPGGGTRRRRTPRRPRLPPRV